MLAALNQVDAILSEVDSKIQVAKSRIEQPATRCRFCSVKIVFRRTDKGVKAYELDGVTLHRCWEKSAKGAKA